MPQITNSPCSPITGAASVAQVVTLSPMDRAIVRAVDALNEDQHPEGYWCYEFEADCTIPSEYILMMHFMDEVDEALQDKIAVYLRDRQCEDGGWALFPGGESDISATVKAYYALKMTGDEADAPHMRRARELVLERGGAAHANVFTRITLALFQQVPWRAVPFIPAEIMLLPEWFPFHIKKVSYWSRTVMVPLFVLCTLKPKAENPRDVHIRELFVVPPELERHYFVSRSMLNRVFFALDRVGRQIDALVPRRVRRSAVNVARDWFVERLNGVDGLGGIFPAMVYAHEALKAMGYPPEHEHRRKTREALRRLLVVKHDHAYCQPCVSPVWDTALASLAIQEASNSPRTDSVLRGLQWLAPQQLLDHPGDWQWKRPGLRGGGWAFEFANGHYPDIDDTPVVAWALHNAGPEQFSNNIERAAEWIAGMQSSNGGWASFDVDNTHEYLNEIPFADHGALLDPPTADVTARCIGFLSIHDRERFAPAIERGIAYLRSQQEDNGSWFGRWGTNYVYGTWSVLTAMQLAGEDMSAPHVRGSVQWLLSCQREDGGWSEDNQSYFEPELAGQGQRSTSFQTAWAVLGLIAAGEHRHRSVTRGIEHLLATQEADGMWQDPEFTAPGFPRVFYLKYHGYSRYFPLWALARYRNVMGFG